MIDTNQFLDNFRSILNIKDRELGLEDKFRDMEEWDSLAFLSIMAMIDEEYGILINAAEFQELHTLGDIESFINQHRQ